MTSRRLVPDASPRWTDGVPGGFLFSADGKDADRALDQALSAAQNGDSPRSQGLLDQIDPARLVVVDSAPTHPFSAFREQFDRLLTMPPGGLVALPTAAMSGFSHKRLRFVVTDPTLTLPDDVGLLVPIGVTLTDQAAGHTVSAGFDPGLLVGVELMSVPRRRYKVERETIKGPRTSKWSVWVGKDMLSVHPSLKEARAEGMLQARLGASRVEVRPWVSRNESDPFLVFHQRLLAQRAVCKAVLATPRRPGAQKIAGWVFAGRSLHAPALTASNEGGR